MYSILKMQLKMFFLSSAFIFLLLITSLNFFILISNAVPQRISLLGILYTDMMFIAFYQFGGNYRIFTTSAFSKNLEISDIDPVKFKITFIFFTILISLIFAFSQVFLVVGLTVTELVNFKYAIKWEYFWWGWFTYWIVINTLVLIGFTYFMYRFISNFSTVFVFLTIFFLIGLLSGGAYGTSLNLDENLNVVGIQQVSLLYWLILLFQPGYYANQMIIFSFKGTTQNYEIMKPLNFSNYNTLLQYSFLLMPPLLIATFFTTPKLVLGDNY